MEPPRVPHHREDGNGIVEDPNITKDSLDSSSSSVRHPTTRYHFHGLAATQTQTQHEECVDNGGSQKENTPASGELQGSLALNSQPCSPHASTSKITSKVPNLDLASHPLGSKGTVAMPTDRPLFGPFEHVSPFRNKAGKAISFQSPRATGAPASPEKAVQPSKSMPSRSGHYYRRSPSQDSFAGPVSQDPERQFFASTKQFDVPLSELGIASPQETHSSEPQPPAAHTEGGSSIIQAMASAYADEKRNRAVIIHGSANHGRILVAATPSHSGSSQGESPHVSQQSDDAFYGRQPDPTYDEIPDDTENTGQLTQLFEDSSELSSSYERLLAGESSPVATQAVELQATQPDELDAHMDVQMEVDGRINNATRTEFQTPAGPSLVPSTGPRSIVSMIDPSKRWRYEKYGIFGRQPAPSHNPLQTPTRGEVILETQPSDISTPGGPARPSRGFKDVHRSDRQAHPLSSPSRPDAMDVVPDSEPPQAGHHTFTPGRPTGPQIRESPAMRVHSQAKLHPGDVALLSTVVEQTTAGNDEEEEEEDIPLAATRALKIGQAGKGKGKVVAPSHAVGADTTKPSHQLGAGTSAQGRSWDKGVPSSAPEQDALDTVNTALVELTSRAKGGRRGKPASVVSSRKTRSRSASSNIPAKKRRVSSDTDDDELRLTAEDSVLIPKAEKEEEEETEPADEDDMDVDIQEDDLEAGPSMRKRKRGPAPKAGAKKVSKVSTKPNTVSRSTPTIPSRPNKRLRSVVSTSRPISEPATRVFALWKQDSYYYSGTVHSHGPSKKYLVKFDDKTEDNVDVSKMRRCELRVDDEVILVEDDRRAKVKDVQINQPQVTVEVDDGDEVEVFDVEVQDLRIAGRTILKQWQDRALTADVIIPVIKPKPLKSTPSPSKASVLSAASVKLGRGKSLNRTGLVITLSPGRENWERTRDDLMMAIKSNGGTVIEDWSHIFPMEGIHSNANKRWVGVAGDVRWLPKDGIQRVFLLADDANQKPKFLIALALGIPCLSFEWLHDTVDKVSVSPFVILYFFLSCIIREPRTGSHTCYLQGSANRFMLESLRWWTWIGATARTISVT